MAELLIFARNNTHIDPEKDRRGCYKRGMIVAVQPDGFQWGREESKAVWLATGGTSGTWPGHFVIVKITGVTVAQVQEAIARQTEDDTGTPVFEANGITPRVFRRRRWRILVDSIPNSIKNQLLNNGEVTVTASQVRNYIQRIRDNSIYTGI